ncbi:hypothetical protein [Glaciihabitans sp. dw_435]|uniref:hypothetical protein n=1 Tax=Glaciihabitans sp. dw_435 TaxID=2720081 RepID=UPI001BD5F517|nr:hypothetical protein [Glaciihabitans sp. dw_435]
MPERVPIRWDDLADLDFDTDNPRHEPGMLRRDIINYLVGNESVLGLARDIADVGLSPLDAFGAIRTPEGGYTIMEGNRRLCALILLHDPSLAPAKERKSFSRIASSFDPDVLDIQLAVFEDATEANLWIERKHSGQGGGIGPRSWTATQQARHYREKTGNALALRLIEYAVDNKLVGKKDVSGVITTVTRFISNPFVRQYGLGITTGAADPEFAFLGTQSLFDLRLGQLMGDIVGRTNGATSRTNSAERAKYAQDFLVPISESAETDTENPETSATGTPTSGGGETGAGGGGSGGGTGTGGGQGAAPGGGGAGTGGKPVHPNDRKFLVPSTFTPSVRSERLKRVLAELRAVQKVTPIAAALLVRVFIESVCVTYLETRGVVVKINDKLHMTVHGVLTRIEIDRTASLVVLTKAENGALAQLKNQVAQQEYVYSAAYLGLVAHGSAFPEWSTLTSKWDEIEPILRYVAINSEPPIEPS